MFAVLADVRVQNTWLNGNSTKLKGWTDNCGKVNLSAPLGKVKIINIFHTGGHHRKINASPLGFE